MTMHGMIGLGCPLCLFFLQEMGNLPRWHFQLPSHFLSEKIRLLSRMRVARSPGESLHDGGLEPRGGGGQEEVVGKETDLCSNPSLFHL